MTPPKATVIMNTYRENLEWLKVAIESYKSQVGVDVQLLVSCVRGDPNIPIIQRYGCQIVRNETPGIYQQINAAIPHITGDWVCYASSNDKAAPNKLIVEIENCLNSQKSVCYSAFWKTDINLKHLHARTFQPYDYNSHLAKGNYVSDCALVRSDVLKKYAPFRTEWGNHAFYDLWLRIYEGEGDVFIYNPTPTWYYRGHDGQKLRRQNSAKLQKLNRESRERMLEWHKEIFPHRTPVDILLSKHPHLFVTEGKMKINWPQIMDNNLDTVSINDGVNDGINDGVNDGVTHFVYVYVQGPARWNELAISIQSIRNNFQGKARFFCVGDNPGIKDVVHIPVAQVKGRGCKPKDAAVKLKAIANCELISEDFIYCYDDCILLRQIKAEWFDRAIAVEHVKDYTTHWKGAHGIIPDQGWRNLFLKTFAVLSKKGLPTWNAETHLPRKMSKSKIMQTFERFGEAVCSDALFYSLYFNQHIGAPNVTLRTNASIKAGLHRAYDNPKKIMAEIKGRVWLNYSDPALNELFKKTVKQIMKGGVKV